ncbi:MAG: hypothetical protein WDN00_00755 [Limisphaerales bacterium]
MKTRTKKWLLVVVAFLCVLVGLGAAWLWYLGNYVHQHCIKQTSLAFNVYASDHNGQFPASTNGFGNALLLLVQGGYLGVKQTMWP